MRPVLAWFDAHARPLPWRAADRTPWGVLVSEVMLQQTPVARALPAWTAWMDRWPTPAALADADAADVLRAWDRLGYPRRALRLLECARTVVREHDGALPTDEASLRALPGVGEYTAAAVVAFAHGRRSVVLDTNVRRVLARTLGGAALPPPAMTRAEVAAAASVVPESDDQAARWSAAVMELGALVCTARSPQCQACPVRDQCRWLSAGFPPDAHAARRRRQGFAGTDRELRGAVMSLLRASEAAVPGAVVRAHLSTRTADQERVETVLAGLVRDGLAVQLEHDRHERFSLPGTQDR